MKLRVEAHYDATPAEVFAVIADPGFQAAKVEATTFGPSSSSVSRSGERAVVRTERTLPTDGFPDAARSIVGHSITVAESQEWGPAEADGSRTAQLAIIVHHAPVTLHGQARLVPAGRGTTEIIEADLRCSVPLLGHRIERAAEAPIHAAIDVEVRLIRERLTS